MTDGIGGDLPPDDHLAVRDLRVPPAPVGGPRGTGRAGVAALALVVVVIAIAVGLAQVAPVTPVTPSVPRSTVPAGSAAPGSPVAAVPTAGTGPVPDAAAILAGTSPRLSRDDLAAAVRNGTLDGRLVFVDGTIRATATRCESLAQGPAGCMDLEIPGIGVPVWQGEPAIPWQGDPPPGAWIVTVARTGGLVYLGSLLPSRAGPLPITELPAGGLPGPAGTLHEAHGFLVVKPRPACGTGGAGASTCPASSPFLANVEPLPTGALVSDAGDEVVIAASMPEVDPAAVVTAGTFLVTRLPGTEGRWEVVARYVPPRAVRVLVP